MVWFQVDDGMWSHPKMLGLSDGAGWLWVRAGAYCAQHLTDGVVPPAALRILAATDSNVAELVDAGLWEIIPEGHTFHDWDAYQRTREKVEADRAAARERQAKSRARKGHADDNDVTNGVSHAVTSPVTNGVTNPVTNGVSHTARALPNRTEPSRPLLVVADATEQPKPKPKDRSTTTPEEMPITDVMRRWAASRVPSIDIETQTENFLDHNRSKGSRYVDWNAAWRKWMRNAADYQARDQRNAPKATPVNQALQLAAMYHEQGI